MSTAYAPLRPRGAGADAERFARSAAAPAGAHLRTEDFTAWLAARRRANRFRVERIPFAGLDGWAFDPATGNLGHRSGRFFTVEGLHATGAQGPFREWHQPIISQPEVGILGILVKEFDGVLHLLMQAKMEPGNRNVLQLSPTVQATRSNYTRVHQGASVRYIEYFTDPRRGRVLADALQSEHGSWFLGKRNRNMIVEALDDVPPADDFCWLTLHQVAELLHRDNLVNMDSRTVLAGIPSWGGGPEPTALHTDAELRSWFTTERTRHDIRARRIPLAEVRGWQRGELALERPDGRFFRVVAVSVEAGNREVTGWSQPLFEPTGVGVTAFLTREFDGVPHYLAHARVEGGFRDTVELGPTVQYVPDNYAGLPPAQRPPFLDAVLNADPARIRYQAVHSEEGGRFLNAESRYLVVAVGESAAPRTPPLGYRWVTAGQLRSHVQHSHYVNVQARTLLACLGAAEVRGR